MSWTGSPFGSSLTKICPRGAESPKLPPRMKVSIRPSGESDGVTTESVKSVNCNGGSRTTVGEAKTPGKEDSANAQEDRGGDLWPPPSAFEIARGKRAPSGRRARPARHLQFGQQMIEFVAHVANIAQSVCGILFEAPPQKALHPQAVRRYRSVSNRAHGSESTRSCPETVSPGNA